MRFAYMTAALARLDADTPDQPTEAPVPHICATCYFGHHASCLGVALVDMNVNLGTVQCDCLACRPTPDQGKEGEG